MKMRRSSIAVKQVYLEGILALSNHLKCRIHSSFLFQSSIWWMDLFIYESWTPWEGKDSVWCSLYYSSRYPRVLSEQTSHLEANYKKKGTSIRSQSLRVVALKDKIWTRNWRQPTLCLFSVQQIWFDQTHWASLTRWSTFWWERDWKGRLEARTWRRTRLFLSPAYYFIA